MRARALALPLLVLASAFAGCGDEQTVTGPAIAAQAKMSVTSPGFEAGARIPVRFTCDGANVAPPLHWSAAPVGTRALALLVEDPDAPGGTFVHWAVFDIHRAARGVSRGRAPAGASEAKGSSGKARYVGPCPPPGDRAHRYVFAIYALRHALKLPSGVDAQRLRDAIADEAIAQGRLVARYGR